MRAIADHPSAEASGPALPAPDLTDRVVLVPGGTGTVGTGVVRAHLAAGAHVVVPTRSEGRGDHLRELVDAAHEQRLHLITHDYTSFAGADDLADQVVHYRGRLDGVVAPIGGWWAGGPLTTVTEQDWLSAFTELATTHLAVLRACLPRLNPRGSYSLVVGDSATWPVPGSGLVSMEQAALLMMARVAAAESGADRRVFSLVLGPVDPSSPAQEHSADALTADHVGRVAVAALAGTANSATVPLHDADEVAAAIAELGRAAGASQAPTAGAPGARSS